MPITGSVARARLLSDAVVAVIGGTVLVVDSATGREAWSHVFPQFAYVSERGDAGFEPFADASGRLLGLVVHGGDVLAIVERGGHPSR